MNNKYFIIYNLIIYNKIFIITNSYKHHEILYVNKYTIIIFLEECIPITHYFLTNIYTNFVKF